MAPIDKASLPNEAVASIVGAVIRRNETTSQAESGDDAYNERVWRGGLSVASVDLIAMIVSDAGISSANPEWWNCSPLGCVLLGLQPRGGWQIMQRAVQWGDDRLAHVFGIKCDRASLYQYFACTARNRIEVWDSPRFISPTAPDAKPEATTSTAAPTASSKPRSLWTSVPSRLSRRWQAFAKLCVGVWALLAGKNSNGNGSKNPTRWRTDLGVDGRGSFTVHRPTKLIDGSRGGQAFMCDLLRPPRNPDEAYSIQEQAKMQLLSVLLVTAGLMPTKKGPALQKAVMDLLRDDFSMNDGLGKVFYRLQLGLVMTDALLLAFIVLVFFSVFRHNYFGVFAPYGIQLASLASWSMGAIGLLLLGGNPRVSVTSNTENIARHILDRLYELPPEDVASRPTACSDAGASHVCQGSNGSGPSGTPHQSIEVQIQATQTDPDCRSITLKFGYLHGALYKEGQGECKVSLEEAELICGLELAMERPWLWECCLLWYALHLLASIALQITSSTTATLGSQIMGVAILISTSIFRGMGISGSEEWMIPGWKRRPGAEYGAAMLGKKASRV